MAVGEKAERLPAPLRSRFWTKSRKSDVRPA